MVLAVAMAVVDGGVSMVKEDMGGRRIEVGMRRKNRNLTNM